MLASLLLAGLLLQQDTLEEQMDEYLAVVKDKKASVDLAIQHIDGFVQAYRECQAELAQIEESYEFGEMKKSERSKARKPLLKTSENLAKTVGAAFDQRKLPTASHKRLWTAAVYAWGQMPSHGAVMLWRVYKDRRFTKDPKFRSVIVAQVGATRDPSQVKPLCDMLDDKDNVIAAAAADTLANYRDAAGSLRRLAVERLVKELEHRDNAASSGDTDAGRDYAAFRGPAVKSLQALTGQRLSAALDWTKWWNDNKNKKEHWRDRE